MEPQIKPSTGGDKGTQRLESFIPSYPFTEDPHIQSKLTRKKEYLEVASKANESLPEHGGFFNHQTLFVRWMSIYDICINISETGVGKSCQIIGLAEALREKGFKRVYVLQKKSTVASFKHQIVCRCTNGRYETDMVKRSQTDQVRRANITREVGKWYSVLSYNDFAKEVEDANLTDEELIEKYSDCLFAIDEGHNFRNKGKMSGDKTIGAIYATIQRVFSLVKRCKFILTTATPSINGVSDFPRVANLVLPPNQQLPEDWDYSKVTIDQLAHFLRNRVFFIRSNDNGTKVERVGSPILDQDGRPAVYEIEQPDPRWVAPPYNPLAPQPTPEMITRQIPSSIVIYPTAMGDIQERVYSQLKDAVIDKNGSDFAFADGDDTADDQQISEGSDGQGFYGAARQVSSFVFPDMTYGGSFPRNGKKGGATTGIGTWIISPRENEYVARPEFNAWVSDINHLRRLSGKFASIVQTETTSPGCGYAYIDNVTGSGAIVLGMCMEAHYYHGEGPMKGMKFTRFNEDRSIFINTSESNRSVCSSESSTRIVRHNFPKAPRYALLTGETPDVVVSNILEVMMSPENIDGEYIKFIIVSPIGRDGINIYNCLRGHLVTAGWHPSGMEQAMARIRRAVSHDLLLKRLREQYAAEGKDPNTAEIVIQEYYHAAAPRSPGLRSIDLSFYRHAELKSFPIAYLMSLLKRLDMGAQINRARNIRPTDADYSRSCDYSVCNYQPYDASEEPFEVDYSTYDILYADKVVKECVADIIQIIQDHAEITFQRLYDLWVPSGRYREKFINMAIDKIIQEKTQIKNRFGFSGYIKISMDKIYFQEEFPTFSITTKQPEEASIYTNSIVGIETNPFDEVVRLFRIRRESVMIEAIKNMQFPEDNPARLSQDIINLNLILNEVSLDMRVRLLEECILLYDQGYKDPYITKIIIRYRAFWSVINEPFEDIQKARHLLLEGRNKFSGKQKIASGGKTRPNYGFVGPPKDGTLDAFGKPVVRVWMHTLNNASYDLTRYATTAKFRNAPDKIRIYKTGTKGFRDSNEYEFLAYNDYAQRQIEAMFEPFKSFGSFGSVMFDGSFRIHFQNDPEISDVREQYNGIACVNLLKYRMIELMYEERIPIPEDIYRTVNQNVSRPQLIQYLITKDAHYRTNQGKIMESPDDKLRYYYTWFASNSNKGTICGVIQNFYRLTGRLLTV